MGKLVFIMGGARSGKSTFAQKLAKKTSPNVVFIATAESLDAEMEERIHNHQKERPSGWVTIEAPMNVSQNFKNENITCDVVILDCLTLLVSNILIRSLKEIQLDQSKLNKLIRDEYDELMKLIQDSKALWIIVSNEVGLGIVPADLTSRIYRDLLGRMNQWVAEKADEVYFMIAGIPVPIQQFRS